MSFKDKSRSKVVHKKMAELREFGQTDPNMNKLYKHLSEIALNERFLRGENSKAMKSVYQKKSVEDTVDVSPSCSHLEKGFMSSGDTRKKQLRFSDQVDVVYYNQSKKISPGKKCREPLADENDQQARSYRKRLNFDQDILSMCEKFKSPAMRRLCRFGLLNLHDAELIALETNLWERSNPLLNNN